MSSALLQHSTTAEFQPNLMMRFDRTTLEKAFTDMASGYRHVRNAGAMVVQSLIDKLLAEVSRRTANGTSRELLDIKHSLMTAQRSLLSFTQFENKRQDMPGDSSRRLSADNFYPLVATSVKKVTMQALKTAVVTLYGTKN